MENIQAENEKVNSSPFVHGRSANTEDRQTHSPVTKLTNEKAWGLTHGRLYKNRQNHSYETVNRKCL